MVVSKKREVGLWFIIPLIALVLATPLSCLAEKKELSSDISFSDVLVRGRFSVSEQRIESIDPEKALDALLVYRKSFRKRIQRSARREKE